MITHTKTSGGTSQPTTHKKWTKKYLDYSFNKPTNKLNVMHICQ